MTFRQTIILTTIVLIVLIVIGNYLGYLSLIYLIPIVLVYLTISALGSIKIGWNYYIRSYNGIKTDNKIVSITFDDGPHQIVTPQLLDVLKKHNVKATFFCIGSKVNSNKSVVQSIVNEGHLIGNHSYYHSNFFDIYTTNRMVNEIDLTNNDIYKITGVKPMLFRPPFGVTNPLLRSAIQRTNMISIGWSLRSFDTVKDIESTYKKLVNKTKPGDIVLFHDTLDFVPELLDRYLLWLKSNNFKIVGLDKLLNIVAYAE
jgi:peptidoglycan/xylan/chitin deacetylase (PgdA/CDA1 family)